MIPPHALVVDDDSSIRVTLRMMLEELGYAVTEASSAEQALQRIGSTQAAFRLIVTDFEMPGISGVALIRKIIAVTDRAPPVMVLFTGVDLEVDEIRWTLKSM
jgi:CheY-like chemotaxis protein